MSLFSNVQVFPLKKSHPTIKANGTVVISDAVKVKFTLWNGPKGLFVGFPGEKGQKINEKTGKQEFYPYISVIDDSARKELQKAVIAAYNTKTGNKMSQGEAAGPSSQVEEEEIPF